MNVEKKYFSNINNRERAIFEGAISMGGLFHQFVGTPVSKESIESLKIAMTQAIELQPGIDKVEIIIDEKKLNEQLSDFDYTDLNGELLDIKIYSKIETVRVIVRMKFIDELNYPLMYIEDISE